MHFSKITTRHTQDSLDIWSTYGFCRVTNGQQPAPTLYLLFVRLVRDRIASSLLFSWEGHLGPEVHAFPVPLLFPFRHGSPRTHDASRVVCAIRH